MKSSPESGNARAQPRGGVLVVAIWIGLAAMMALLARQNFSLPGLYYDEAVFAGLAKDFITGQAHHHMPGIETINFLGRPFPVFVQSYLGALKTWMVMPAMWLFGSSVAVLRLTTLSWAMLTLLFLMLAVQRWLGLKAAIIAGAILIFDPVYFFLATLDWGVATSSLFCRCVSFYLVVSWWRSSKGYKLFLAGFFLGLAFFNKVDFAAVLVGTGIAGFCFYGKHLWPSLRAKPRLGAISTLGFLAGAWPMLFQIRKLLASAASGGATSGANELSEKSHTLLAMYDGSYFYRLMEVGGLFNKMYDHPAPVHSLLYYVLIIAIAVLLAIALTAPKKNETQLAGFLLTGFVLTSACAFLIPGAVRIHHAVLSYPFPQLIIATAINSLWERKSRTSGRGPIRAVLSGGLVILLGSQLYVIFKTEHLIRETGGRGRWTNAFDTFCLENKNRSDLAIISLDWGFNEQLAFLTDGPQLAEPFWGFNQTLPPLSPNPNYIYLAHAPEYSVLRYDAAYLNKLQTSSEVEVTPHFDRQNQPAFYTIQFRPR